MTVQRRGESGLMEMNYVVNAPMATRHHWCFPGSTLHLHVFILLQHGSLCRGTSPCTYVNSSYSLKTSSWGWFALVFPSVLQSTGLYQRLYMLQKSDYVYAFSPFLSFNCNFSAGWPGWNPVICSVTVQILILPVIYGELFYWRNDHEECFIL